MIPPIGTRFTSAAGWPAHSVFEVVAIHPDDRFDIAYVEGPPYGGIPLGYRWHKTTWSNHWHIISMTDDPNVGTP
jgi:hypothetical protein